jgi:hypothetical protein
VRVCRAAWLIGVSVREYREIEAGEVGREGPLSLHLGAEDEGYVRCGCLS